MNAFGEPERLFAMPADFHRLGLRRGECRSVAIRDATQNAVQRLAGSSSPLAEESVDRQLGQLATAAYRLLDPRYRSQLYERVQLSYATEQEDDFASSQLSRNALLEVPEAMISYDITANEEDSSIEEAHRGESIAAARDVVRWIRHTEEIDRALPPKWLQFTMRLLRSGFFRRSD